MEIFTYIYVLEEALYCKPPKQKRAPEDARLALE